MTVGAAMGGAGGNNRDNHDESEHAPATSGRDARCPFCGSADTEELSPFASQLSTRQFVCRTCHTPFEYFGRDSVGV